MASIEELRELIGRTAEFSFARASGPGGQHVNKTSSKVHLRLDLASLAALIGAAAVERARARLAPRLDAEGKLLVASEEERSQLRNREEAVDRAAALVLAAIRVQRKRVPTRPGRAARERRLSEKKHGSERKSGRKIRPGDE